MNLTKLFEMQKGLREHIGYNEPDRFNKLILALLVELGECANEQRSWKFWSKDQESRTLKCIKEPELAVEDGIMTVVDEGVFTNPLLEEYVDVLHFILELGLEIDFTNLSLIGEIQPFEKDNIVDSYINLYKTTCLFSGTKNFIHYSILFEEYLLLGQMLGFTWEQIEQAYYEKNKVNHQRQESGY